MYVFKSFQRSKLGSCECWTFFCKYINRVNVNPCNRNGFSWTRGHWDCSTHRFVLHKIKIQCRLPVTASRGLSVIKLSDFRSRLGFFSKPFKLFFWAGAISTNSGWSEICTGIRDFATDGGIDIIYWHWLCSNKTSQVTKSTWKLSGKSLNLSCWLWLFPRRVKT